MDAYISIDQGTTSSRSILFGEDGSILNIYQKEFKQIYPKPGWVEHDPEEIWETTKSVLTKLYNSEIAKKYNVRGIGITNQRETTIVWDKKTGKPLYNAIVWQDRRTSDFCKKLVNDGLENKIISKSGLVIDPYFSASKIKWILDNVPDARSKAKNNEICFGTVDSFLLWRLTDKNVHATDATNASRTSLYNIEKLEWDEELLEIFDVPKCIMPNVMDSNSKFGNVSKNVMDFELPILSILGDQQAAAVGQACFEPGSIKSTYGTGCFVIINSGDKIIKSKSRLLGTICYMIDGKATYALEGSIFVAGAVVQWLRDNLNIINDARETQEIVETMKDNSDVYLVPAFTGLGCPYWDPDARGALYGITRDTGKNEITRAAIESVAYQTRDLFKAMSEDGIVPSNLKVDGGMTGNDWLMQFLANILNIKVNRPKITETTALGAAMMAAYTDGKYSTLEELSQLWNSEKTYISDMNDDNRNNLLQKWDYYISKTLT
tara:strand:- start:101 stop:1576 length:1476 start_codon:yes stop_codon:yes gene_type:complete